MYCPNCGQQQISGEMRFCSRCGLALSGLAEWLASGRLPLVRREEGPVELSPRRKGIRRAAKLMFFSAVLFPVFLFFSAVIGDGFPMIVPITLFFVSLVMMLYARLFGDKNAPAINQASAQTSAFKSTPAREYLPPPTNMPVPPQGGRQQVRTNELAQPPSVTEHTTRLLDNE